MQWPIIAVLLLSNALNIFYFTAAATAYSAVTNDVDVISVSVASSVTASQFLSSHCTDAVLAAAALLKNVAFLPYLIVFFSHLQLQCCWCLS